MSDKVTKTIIVEVTGVDQHTYYPHGYAEPAERITTMTLGFNHSSNDSLRSASIRIPGDLPLGTRFKLVLEQIDDVTPAHIKRGALPVIENNKLIEGSTGDVQ